MQIEIVSVTVNDMGKYQMALVAYRKDGKLGEKKLMSFGGGVEAYNKLKTAKAGEIYEVTTVKNDKGFWDWTAANEPGAAAAPAARGGTTPAPRNTYETPEERALRQKYIVRQSSITNAIALFELDKKRIPTVQDVIATARVFEDFVFGNKVGGGEQTDFLAELDDDVPL